MFPFGSFLSTIPLVILATAYLFYFGASAFNKAKSEDVSLQVNDKVHVVKKEPVISNGKSIYFHKLLVSKSEVCNEVLNILNFHYFPEAVTHYLPDRKIFSYSGGFNLLSRPPPVHL